MKKLHLHLMQTCRKLLINMHLIQKSTESFRIFKLFSKLTDKFLFVVDAGFFINA